MVSSKNKFEDSEPQNSDCTKSGSQCVNTSEVNVNSYTASEKRIYLYYTAQIVDPKSTPIKRYPNEDDIKVLIVPEKGGQTLIIFTLPKDTNGTVQDIITRLEDLFIENTIKIFLVTDPVHNVRYVVQLFPNKKINGRNTNGNSLDHSRKVPHAANRLSHSCDGQYANRSENELVTSTQKPKFHLKRSLKILAIYPAPPVNGSITITTDDLNCLDNKQYLNDIIIDFYLKYLMLETLSSADQNRIHLFSSFFYIRLTSPRRPSINGSHLSALRTENGEIQHAKVKRWTKNVNIFEKDFVVIPIQENKHWFLTIICYPNMIGAKLNDLISKSLNSNHRPRILIFESIPSLKFMRSVAAKVLKSYIQCEYKAKFGRDCTLSENDLDAVYPDVPRQYNTTDCGLYLLQYAENFFKDYVSNQELSVPLKSLKSWFDIAVIKNKRDQLKKLIIKLASDSQIFKKRRVTV